MEDENQNQIDDHEEATIGMEEADQFDFDRALHLMNVIEKCATVGVKATSIAGLAQAALNEMNEEAKDIAKRRAEAFAKREVEVAAQNAEKRRLAMLEAEAKAKSDAQAADEAARSAKVIEENDPPVRRPVVRPNPNFEPARRV